MTHRTADGAGSGQIAGRLLPSLSLPNGLSVDDLTHDPGKLAERRVDTLCHDTANSRWYTEALTMFVWVREFAHRIQVPTLWLVAGADRIADPEASRVVHQRIQVPCIYREFPDMFHEVLNETDRAQAFALIHSFIEQQLAT